MHNERLRLRMRKVGKETRIPRKMNKIDKHKMYDIKITHLHYIRMFIKHI